MSYEDVEYCGDCGCQLEDGYCENCSNNTIPDKKWQSSQATSLDSWSHWVWEQRKIAKSLGLTEVYIDEKGNKHTLSDYLGKTCDICGKSARKGSHLPLCENHKAEWARKMNRERVQRWRDRQKKNRES